MNLRFKSTPFTYTDQGKGPAIIFLHGFLENQGMWEDILKALPKTYRKVTLDLPGHGHSGNLGYIHTMAEMAEVVKALADHLRLKKFFLCGHSMGGYVALAFAEKHPDFIKGLILMNSHARADSKEKRKGRDAAIRLAKRDHKSFIRKSIPMLFRSKNRKVLRETVNEVKQQALKTSQQGVIAALEGMKARPDREVLLHFAPYPVLMIAAKKDPTVPFEILEEQLHGEKVTAVVTENGHMGHLEDTDTVVKALKEFLRHQG